ncbi:SGNH hydrolase-type esterase domain-containing protein [Xylaria sp. FL1777]|nr:SGNH hydrolase-type esterase domain-containing protein [Xylaria sp. FL1777]
MFQNRFLLVFLAGLRITSASPFNRHIARDVNPAVSKATDPSTLPKYVPPAMNRDITEWFAIGDSFSAGISADVPGDLLNGACNRFKQSYPNKMNLDKRLPGNSTSRTFVFASCSDDSTPVYNQIDLLLPDPKANFPKLEKPQLGTVSLSWDDLGLPDILNACIYQWVGYSLECDAALKAAQGTLAGPNSLFAQTITLSLINILTKARTANPSFQLYVTGYIRLWNDANKQCDTISWAPLYKAPAYLTTSVRQDMNSLILKLNDVIQQVVTDLDNAFGGVYFVAEFEQKFDGHRFCEVESDQAYHMMPIDQRTWFIHYESPYGDPSSLKALGSGTFFDVVDSILIPPKDGKSTADQIKTVKGNLTALNAAYGSVDSMTAALNQLARADAKYGVLPICWTRLMHPKGSGYNEMASAVIDNVLKYSGTGVGPADPGYPQGLHCTGKGVNNFLKRDDLNQQITKFCADAAAQKNHDKNSGSISRIYNAGTRYEVHLGIDWPQGLDISANMQANCVNNMTIIMDGCDGNDPNNPLNWKRGGKLGAGWVNYDIIPTVDQGYTPGTCSVNLQEDERWVGVDRPGSERIFTYYIERATMKDGAGKTIGTLGFAPNGVDPALISAGDGHSLAFNSKLPDSLIITPEAAGHPRDYIQFAMGSQSWRTTTTTGSARCDTGGWSSDYSPASRDMECLFQC